MITFESRSWFTQAAATRHICSFFVCAVEVKRVFGIGNSHVVLPRSNRCNIWCSIVMMKIGGLVPRCERTCENEWVNESEEIDSCVTWGSDHLDAVVHTCCILAIVYHDTLLAPYIPTGFWWAGLGNILLVTTYGMNRRKVCIGIRF